MKKIINFIVSEEDHKKRVDIILGDKLKDISRSKIKKIIETGNLLINNNKILEPSKKARYFDKINFTIPEENKFSLKPYDYKLDIIFEDEDLIVLNKKSGISIHPGPGNYDNTIVNALMNYNGKKLSNVGEQFRPGIVHRLDKNTSGLILVAKNNYAHNHLADQFKKHSVERVYNAIIWGKIRPINGKIDTLIKRSSNNRQLMEVGITKGKRAITNYKTIEIFEGDNAPSLSLIECKLETGRTHQIRVHLNYKGNSILGDKQYKKKYKRIDNTKSDIAKLIKDIDRQLLHAKSISFVHPSNNKRLEFTSNLPSDFDKLLKKLRNM